MKFGQALSRVRGRHPRRVRRPVPRVAGQAPDGGPSHAHRRRPPHARRAVRPRLAGPVRRVRRHTRGRGQHRPGASRRMARRPGGRRQGAVPRRGGGAALRPAPAVAHEPLAAAAHARAGDQAADRRAARADGGGAGLPRRGGQPAGVRHRVRRRRQGLRAEGRGVGAEGDGHGVGHRPEAVRRHPRRHPEPSATTPPRCWPSSTTPRLRGWGCCTPTRTRATSSCSTTDACSCSTSARSPGSPTASPGRCRSWCGWRWRTAPTTCSRCCAGRASCCRARR